MRSFIILFFIFYVNNVFSAEYKYVDFNGRSLITINGEIKKNEFVRFKRMFSLNPGVDGVLLQSNGGNLEEALKIGRLIKRERLDTAIETYCVSACFFIFISGEQRYIYNESYLAIHRPYKIKNGVIIDDEYGSKVFEKIDGYLSFLSVNPSEIQVIMDLVYGTSSNSIRELKPGELNLKMNYYLEPIFS